MLHFDERYQVERVGSGAHEALDGIREQGGRVVARFERTLTVRAGNGRLLTLHGSDTLRTPFSLSLHASPPHWPGLDAIASLHHAVHDEKHDETRDETLIIGTLRVDLGASRIGSADCLPTMAFSGPASAGWGEEQVVVPSAAVHLSQLKTWAATSAFGAWWRVEGPVTEAVAPSVATLVRLTGGAQLRALVDALRQIDEPGAEDEAMALLGLGPGLTPSGDDALVGLFAAWLALDPPGLRHARGRGRSLLASLVAHAPERTTPISAELLYHLARGRLSDPLRRLLVALAGDDESEVGAAAASVAAWGHTSGRDGIAGVVALLYATQTEPPPWRTTTYAA